MDDTADDNQKRDQLSYLEQIFGIEFTIEMYAQTMFMHDFSKQLADRGLRPTMGEFYKDRELLTEANDKYEEVRDEYLKLAWKKRGEEHPQ